MNAHHESTSNAADETPWFEQAFQQEYLDLYLHRDLTEASRAVRFLTQALALDPSQRLLDLCCGPGRHLAFLKDHVGWAVGLDLSRPLLRRAQIHGRLTLRPNAAAAQIPPRLVRADMRSIPLAGASLDRVVNLFTSFGYFEKASENLAVLREIARVLRPGGLLAMDHINRAELLKDFSPRSERRLPSGMTVLEERHWDAREARIEKRVTLRGAAGDEKQWLESVRVYEPGELETMLRETGLVPEQRIGNYDGNPWTNSSPRLILIARREEP